MAQNLSTTIFPRRSSHVTGLELIHSPAGNGGTVNLTSSADTVTVNNRIEVSSDDPTPTQTPPPPIRRSAKGGHINLESSKTSGVAVNVSNTAQLLALLNAAQPSQNGGQITILAKATTGNANIDVNGVAHADKGLIDFRNNGASGQVNLTNADLRADTLKVAALGTNGALNISGGTISADTTMQLYAQGSSGVVNFLSNVTLSGASLKYIVGDTVNVSNNVVVTVSAGNNAQVYTNHANYSTLNGGLQTGATAGRFLHPDNSSGAVTLQLSSNTPPVLGAFPGH